MPAAEFDAAVDEWAVKLASKSPVIMRLGKDAMYRQLDMAFDDALDYLRAQLSIAFSTEDIVEGVTRVLREARSQLDRPLTMDVVARGAAAAAPRTARPGAGAGWRRSPGCSAGGWASRRG